MFVSDSFSSIKEGVVQVTDLVGYLALYPPSTYPAGDIFKQCNEEIGQLCAKSYREYSFLAPRSTLTIGPRTETCIATFPTQKHRSVVHHDNFVDLLTRVHTQEAESAWARLKYHIKREKGVRREDIPAFLHEQMWRDWRGGADVFRSLRVLIAKYHPL